LTTWEKEIVVGGRKSGPIAIVPENVFKYFRDVHQEEAIGLEDVSVGAVECDVGEGVDVVQLAEVGRQLLCVPTWSAFVDDGRSIYYSRCHSLQFDDDLEKKFFY